MSILIIVFIILFLLQLTLGVFAWRLRKDLEKKYAFPLSEQTEPVTIVEKYYQDQETTFQILASEQLMEPAFAEKNLLLINKSMLYKKDLYTNFYIIFQAELTKNKYQVIRLISKILSFIFVLSTVILVLFILLDRSEAEPLVYIAIALQAITLYLSVYSLYKISKVLNNTMIIAKGLLSLDDVEEARASGLKNDLKYSIFEYPLEIVWRIIQFFRI
jgi:hypothetical protein